MENLDLERGGTALSMAIQESIQYFINSENRPFGNILVLTDAEETDGGIELGAPEGVSIAVVGVGTAKGAPVPMRNSRGVFQGNKKYQGETVISKMDEKFLKAMGKEVEHFKYWVASSYSLPTEEILDFFNRALKTKASKDDFRIRPVLANYLLVPGVLALILAFLFKNFRTFALTLLIATSMSGFYLPNAAAQRGLQANPEMNPKEEPEKTEEILRLEKRFAQNKLGEAGKLKLATELLKQGFAADAKSLFQEILPEKVTQENKHEHFNLGAAQFKANEIQQGMNTYSKLLDYLKENPGEINNELAAKTKLNMLKAIQVQASQQKKKQNEKGEKDDSGKEGKEQQGGSKGNSDQKDKGGDQSESQDGKEGDEEQKNKDGKEGDKEDQNKERQGDSEGGDIDKEKMPSILKQLLSDDNQLQKKVIDADTVERKTREKKDW
ncbi:MAG: hypothetical protein WEB87_00985 [Bacteriovoracaceae bacterium]